METKFAKAVMIRQMSRAPPLPMPLNILHFILEILHSNCNTWNDSHYSTVSKARDTFSFISYEPKLLL